MPSSATKKKKPRPAAKETGHGPILTVPYWQIIPSSQNDKLYRPPDEDDPALKALAESIRDNGIQEPLVLSLDDFIVSGHRRFAAGRMIGLAEFPVRRKNIRSTDPDFLKTVREFNRQREKTFAESIREQVIDALDNPGEAYSKLCEVRYRESEVDLDHGTIDMGDPKKRSRISAAKMPMIKAINKALKELKRFLPTSNRTIFYRLLNDPPLRHASKPHSKFANNLQCYKDLNDLLLRARLEGLVPIDAINDETRPVTHWAVHSGPSAFVREHLDDLFSGYRRNMMQSQPNHIEIVCEKNTAAPIVKRVAGRYSIPVITGRGYSSYPPLRDLRRRFEASGKSKCIVVFVTDHDPEGWNIGESFARLMRDEHHVSGIVPVKAALTFEQVEEYALPHGMKAKPGSSRYKSFIKRFGEFVFELEALNPADLETIIEQSIESLIDIEAFQREQDAEEQDAGKIEALRRAAVHAVGEIATEIEMEDE